jgi:hypothetical protein
MLRNIIVLSLALITCGFANASGFGFQMGKAPSNYKCTAINAQPGAYSCSTAPKPHSAFESYILKASEKHGICWVKGVGRDIDDNGYGSNTKSAHAELVTLLSKPYGPADESMDLILPGSLWDGPNEWLMSIKKQERIVTSIWKDLAVTSKPDLDRIYLAVSATGSKTGWVGLEYYAKYYDDCAQANAESESDAL